MPVSTKVPIPRDCGDRIIAGLLAIMFGVLSGGCFFASLSWTPKDLTERLFKGALEHVFFGLAGICVIVLVWSVFTPRWMERIIVNAENHIIGTLVAVILLSAVAIFGAVAAQ